MILFTRTADIAPGQMAAAIGFAKKVAAYLEAEYATKLQVSMPVAGKPFSIHWTTSYDGLEQFETQHAKLMQDTKYTDMVVSASACFIAGSARDTLTKTI